MSGSRSALAGITARSVPDYQIPLQVGRQNFRYPTFGGPPVTPPAVPAAAVPAAPRVTVSSAGGGSRYNGEYLAASQQPSGAPQSGGYQTVGDSPDAGTSPTGFGGPGTATVGPEASSKFGADPLGPDPGRVNSLADAARVGQTLANFGLAVVSANPVSIARSVVNSPVGLGLMKNASAAFGISRATAAPEDLSTLDKPEPDEGRTALGTLASIAGFGGPSAKQGGAKGPGAKGAETVEAEEAPATTTAPAAAPTVAANAPPAAAPNPATAPAPTATAQDLPTPPSFVGPPEDDAAASTSKDFGDAPAESFNNENTTPGGAEKGAPSESSQAAQADGGGKGGDAGTGSNGESSPGSSEGGEKRMGGPIDSDGDGRLSAVPITAHEGEFVLSPEAVAMVGPDILQRINDMALDAAGHPPRPINPQAMVQSPLSQLRAGAVSPAPGRAGSALISRPGQQGAPVYLGQLPMPGYGGAPIPVPQSPPAVPAPLAMVTTVAAPSAAPPLPGPPPGPFPAPPTTPMGVAEGFSENAVPFTDQGQRPLIGPPPVPPAPPAPRTAAPRQGGGGLTADLLNAMSLDLARGGGHAPAGGEARAAYDRISQRMADGGKPAFRMGGMVQPAAGTPPLAGNEAEHYADMPWGQHLPHALHEPPPMIMFGYDPNQPMQPEGPMEFGPEDLRQRFDPNQMSPAFRMGGMIGAPGDYSEGDDYAEGVAPHSALPTSAAPYANEGSAGGSPFGTNQPGAGGADDVKQRLMALPPEMQQAVAAAIGGDPMVASALLAVLGPHFAPLIQAAMATAAPPQPDPLAALMGGGGGPPMQPIG